MQRQINKYKYQVEESEHDKVRVSNENVRVIEAHENQFAGSER